MPEVRAIATLRLKGFVTLPPAPSVPGREAAANHQLLADDVKRFLERPLSPARPATAPEAPPGAPIGEPALDWLRRWGLECGRP